MREFLPDCIIGPSDPCDGYKFLQEDRDRLADENKRLRDALEFYADEENYEIRHVSYGIGPDPFVFRDGGKTAREALKEK